MHFRPGEVFDKAEDAENFAMKATQKSSRRANEVNYNAFVDDKVHGKTTSRVVPVPADLVEDLQNDIIKSGGGTQAPLHARDMLKSGHDPLHMEFLRNLMKNEYAIKIGEISDKVGDVVGKIPGSHVAGKFFSNKVQMGIAVGTAALTMAGTAASAHEAGDDNLTVAKKTATAGYEKVEEHINPQHRFTKAFDNFKEGNIGLGIGRTLEGVGDFFGLGDAAEKARVQPAAEKLFEEKGAKALAAEVIHTGENPKYIICGNTTFPDTLNVPNGKGGTKEMKIEDAFRDPKNVEWYKDRLEDKIASGKGDRDVWQSQLDSINGYQRAVALENKGREDEPVLAHSAKPTAYAPA